MGELIPRNLNFIKFPSRTSVNQKPCLQIVFSELGDGFLTMDDGMVFVLTPILF